MCPEFQYRRDERNASGVRCVLLFPLCRQKHEIRGHNCLIQKRFNLIDLLSPSPISYSIQSRYVLMCVGVWERYKRYLWKGKIKNEEVPHRLQEFAQISEKHRNRSWTLQGQDEFPWPICEKKLWFRQMSCFLGLLRARMRFLSRIYTELSSHCYWTIDLCNSDIRLRNTTRFRCNFLELLLMVSAGGDIFRPYMFDRQEQPFSSSFWFFWFWKVWKWWHSEIWPLSDFFLARDREGWRASCC